MSRHSAARPRPVLTRALATAAASVVVYVLALAGVSLADVPGLDQLPVEPEAALAFVIFTVGQALGARAGEKLVTPTADPVGDDGLPMVPAEALDPLESTPAS